MHEPLDTLILVGVLVFLGGPPVVRCQLETSWTETQHQPDIGARNIAAVVKVIMKEQGNIKAR